MKRITDPAFKYTPSHNSDIRKRFAAIKRKQKAQAKTTNVQPLRTRKAGA